MGCGSEILTHNHRPGERSAAFQLHRVGGTDSSGASAAWRGSVLFRARALAVLGTQCAHRLLQGFLLLLETNGLPESRH